jgi:hypothetical protein
MFELTIDHCSGFLECPGGSAYNFELRTGGPIKQSSQNLRRLRCLALLFAAGCIATGSPAQTVRVQATEAAQVATWKTRGWEAPYYWASFTLQGEWW